MDLTRPKSNLSLGFSSHVSPSRQTQMADASTSLQLDSSLRDPTSTRPQVSSIPFQLLEPQTSENPCKEATENGTTLDPEFVEYGEKKNRILGQSMCPKRRRESESSSSLSSISMSSSLKRISVEPDLEARRSAVRLWGDAPLHVADPDIIEIMEEEKQQQYKGIELITSENFLCRAVMEALGSHLTNKYSEGMPGARYYVGNQYIDEIEKLCCHRALSTFGLDSEKWGVNVQPYSCTSSNFAVYTGLLLPGDRIMGLDTPSGGNTCHGYYTPSGKKVSGASIFFESLPYKVNPQTGYVDFDKVQKGK